MNRRDFIRALAATGLAVAPLVGPLLRRLRSGRAPDPLAGYTVSDTIYAAPEAAPLVALLQAVGEPVSWDETHNWYKDTLVPMDQQEVNHVG